MEMASRKNFFSILYDSYLCSRCGNYRYFPKNIRRLSRRSGNRYGKSQSRKKIRIQKHACNDGGRTAAITHRKQCRSRSRTYRNHRRFMLLGRRQSEVCQTEYQKLFADWCRSLHECAVSRTSVRYFRSRRKLRGRSCSLNKGFQIIYLRNRAGCRHWYLCRFICTFWCRAFRISIL